MSVQVTPHPEWVVDLDRALEPYRLAVLTTPVVEPKSEMPPVSWLASAALPVAFVPMKFP